MPLCITNAAGYCFRVSLVRTECWCKAVKKFVQGEELVIDESQAAIEPLPNRERAPLPEPPSTPGMVPFAKRCMLSRS